MKKHLLLASFLILTAAPAAMAQQAAAPASTNPAPAAAANADPTVLEMVSRLQACQRIDTSIARLNCYDEALGDYDLNTITLGAIAKEFGKWQVTRERSSVTESVNTTMTLRANSPVMLYTNKTVWPNLVVRCRDQNITGYLVFHHELGREKTAVTTRMDQLKAITEFWPLSNDMQAAFAPKAENFIKQLLKHERLYAQVTPKYRSAVDTTFDLRGLDKAMTTFDKSCGYDDTVTPQQEPTSPKQ